MQSFVSNTSGIGNDNYNVAVESSILMNNNERVRMSEIIQNDACVNSNTPSISPDTLQRLIEHNAKHKHVLTDEERTELINFINVRDAEDSTEQQVKQAFPERCKTYSQKKNICTEC